MNMLIDPDDPQEERILAALKRLQLTHLRETLAGMLSEAAKRQWTYREFLDQILRREVDAKQGKRVLRLKGGDPFLFGRGGEEIEALAAEGIPFQVCPGVTAAIGAAAYAGIPLTHRDHAKACVFVTGHGKDGKIDLDWTALLQPRQTVAIYMGLRNVEALTREFIARGADPDLPAAIIDNATRPNQRVVVGALATLAAKARAAELSGPAIIVVGKVVTLRDKLDWRPAAESRSLVANGRSTAASGKE